MSEPVTEVSSGSLRGRQLEGCQRFAGIPYAAPPVGRRRFAPPAPSESWTGVREAAEFSPHAPQPDNPFYYTNGAMPPTDEATCLTLNVWTPSADSARRPVMVWFHGGAFTSGGSSTPLYDGSRFARDHDIVIVSANYRLGVLGFTHVAHLGGEDVASSGSVGIQDGVAALKWVRENIAAFGGDPGNVTAFGESAGSSLVSTTLAMPSATGLYRRVILQSGAGHTFGPTEGERAVHELLAALGRPTGTLEDLRALPAIDLVQAFSQVSTQRISGVFRPIADGKVLPESPLAAVRAGRAAGVTILAGTNRDEWRLWSSGVARGTSTMGEDQLRTALASEGLNDVDKGIEIYRRRLGDAAPIDVYAAGKTDQFFRVPTLQLVDAQIAEGGTAYQYLFTWPSPVGRGRLGSCHALELAFVFNTIDLPGRGLAGDNPPSVLATTLNDTWAHFARHGTPSGAAAGSWPAYESESRPTMILDVNCSIEHDPLGDERRLWMEG